MRWTAARYPAINLATIYRTLDLLTSVGLVTQTDLRDRLKGLGTTPIGSTPEELASFQRADIDRWTRVVKTAHLTPEQ